MLRFKGFRASLNFSSGKNSGLDYDEVPTVTMAGAYRQNTQEFIDNGTVTTTNKTITPSMVVLPPSSQPVPPRRSKTKNNLSKSTNDLNETNSSTDNTPPLSHSKSSGNVSSNPRGTEPYRDREPTNVNTQKDSKKNKKAKKEKQPKNTDKESKIIDKESKKADKELKKREKEQKKLEKKQLEEQKKRDKLEAQAQQMQEKLQKEKEKAEAKYRAKEQKLKKDKDNNKSKPIQDRENDQGKEPLTNPLAQGSRNPNTDTLKSSTSLSSAPPPYSESEDKVIRTGAIRKDLRNEKNESNITGHTSFGKPRKEVQNERGETSFGNPRKEIINNERDNTGNTSFGKPVGETPGGSWDMVSQHRQQINRTVKGGTKQKIMSDSQYVTGRTSILNE